MSHPCNEDFNVNNTDMNNTDTNNPNQPELNISAADSFDIDGIDAELLNTFYTENVTTRVNSDIKLY